MDIEREVQAIMQRVFGNRVSETKLTSAALLKMRAKAARPAVRQLPVLEPARPKPAQQSTILNYEYVA